MIAPKVSQIRRIALQKYNYFLNYQNFFQLFFCIDSLIEDNSLYSPWGKIHLRSYFCYNSFRSPLGVTTTKALKELSHTLITLF
nr:MAG TPA: hypothetical protein [Caudoviricetes sp.]DAO70528.1 MAG TPA: hypothetical protein [Caudoviricetes sp.]DAT09844.1 MAG TPA: hypothetical protein [Caudoviricetes sp.]